MSQDIPDKPLIQRILHQQPRRPFTWNIPTDDDLDPERIIAAVDALIDATQAWNIYTVADDPDVQARRRELLAILGITE